MSFKPVSAQVNLPSLEEEILKFWEENKIFEKSIENRKGKVRFVWYEGPPTANGKPHMGHVLQRSLKDLILRFRSMKGFLVERRAGWDTHGLPVEIEVEKELGLKGKQDILVLKDTEFESIKFFNQKCKESVFKYVDDWINLTKRIGFWIDFDSAYVTYDNNYIESVWWFLSEVYKKGLLYKDYKVVPYCPRCGTSLSSHELALGYKDDVEDPSVYVKFELEDEPGTYLLAWTTTPWTLPGNVALVVNPDAYYVKGHVKGETLIYSKGHTLGVPESTKDNVEFKGSDLIGKKYKPLFDFFSDNERAYQVYPADFVSLEEGTGIVHTAVMYGEDDFKLGKTLDLPMKHLVNTKGEFVEEVTDFAGLFVKEADPKIIDNLRKRKLLYNNAETIKHTYPFCWRCDTPILYYALDSWFIKTTAVKEKLLEDNQKINWVPKVVKNGRMKNWLETLIDWNISRNRFWGTPLPIWQCSKGHIRVIGGVGEIREFGGEVLEDLHRPFIDQVIFKCPDCEEEMKRIEDVADVWMDSGAMPFAQWHFPFENEDIYKQWYPADYIVEGIDQTRGWFFTLMAEAMLLGDTPPSPFKNVISTGLILDDKGQKMSKSKGNIVDPMEMFSISGADTMRWYMYTQAPAGGNYLFSKEHLLEKHRRFNLIFWNCYKFFVDYAMISNWKDEEKRTLSILDKWILARLSEVVLKVNDGLEKYDAYNSSRAIEDFVVSDFSTWYIRRSRDRVGPEADSEDRNTCLSVMYEVLLTLSKLLAPFTPFLAEEIYRSLTDRESVHLQDYPTGNKNMLDEELIGEMGIVREIAEKAHAKRKEDGIKLRQPLPLLKYKIKEKLPDELEKILADEVNVKLIGYQKSSNIEPAIELDTKITPKLAEEGKARDLIRQIQQLRKEKGLTLADKTKILAPVWPKDFEELILKNTASVSISQSEILQIIKEDEDSKGS
ncbi:MAG: isoleucyl-tRNA synthetase [Microgenomates group bacterium Gr01-1014_7]|nr:MAG: isoleucyl-tRNA synthetase [Microgenomates group bacterium Gr01-1014_7]